MPVPNGSNYTLNLKHDADLIMKTAFKVATITKRNAKDTQFLSVRHIGDNGLEYRKGTLNIQSSSQTAPLQIKYHDDDNTIKVQLLPQRDGSEHPLLKPLLHVQEAATAAYMAAKSVHFKDAKPPLPFLDRANPSTDWLLKLKSIRYCALEKSESEGFISDNKTAFDCKEHSNVITRFIINIYRITFNVKGEPFFWVSLKAARFEPWLNQWTAGPKENDETLLAMMEFAESDNDDLAVAEDGDTDDQMDAVVPVHKKQRFN